MKKLKIKLLTITLSASIFLTGSLFITYLAMQRYRDVKIADAIELKYQNEISELQGKVNRYREEYVEILQIRDRYRASIKEMVEVLYNKDSYLEVGIGGSLENPIIESDEVLLLQLRTTVATMQDDQLVLTDIMNYLIARKEFSNNFPFVWPLKGNGVPRLTSDYGFRDDIDDKLKFHAGIDIAGKKGDPVIATASGKILQARENHPLYGNLIIIQHKYDFVTYYGHLYKILVKAGQSVKRGDIIAEVGNSGESTGSHLHYEIRRNLTSMDPMDFLRMNF